MRHPHHLPPNMAPTMGVLLPPDPPDAPPAPADACEQSARPGTRTCDQLGVCQGDGRCAWCAPVPPGAGRGAPDAAEQLDALDRMEQFGFAIVVAALAGISAGLMLGLGRLVLEWVGS